MKQFPNHTIQRMGASRLGQRQFVRPWRLAPVADLIVSQIHRMRNVKLLGWLWLVLGSVWSLLALLALIGRTQTDPGYTETRWMWWQNAIQGTIEMGIFVGSAFAGLALLRGWRWSRLAIWILALLWLAFSVLMVSSASGTLALRLLWYGPSLAISLYSPVVLLLVRYERKLG